MLCDGVSTGFFVGKGYPNGLTLFSRSFCNLGLHDINRPEQNHPPWPYWILANGVEISPETQDNAKNQSFAAPSDRSNNTINKSNETTIDMVTHPHICASIRFRSRRFTSPSDLEHQRFIPHSAYQIARSVSKIMDPPALQKTADQWAIRVLRRKLLLTGPWEMDFFCPSTSITSRKRVGSRDKGTLAER